MKKIIYFVILTLSGVCLAISCKKLENGFLSKLIHYSQDPMYIPKGRVFVSLPILPDGSTLPMHIELLHIYDTKTGNIVDDIFSKKYPVTTWTAAYNSKTDTTLALIQAKQKIVEMPAFSINDASGQLQSNSGALNLPGGDYVFDLKISNINGSNIYPKVGHFVLVDTTTFDNYNTQYDRLYKVGDESVTKLAQKPTVTITRTADAPNVVIFKILDKNGVPFNPQANEIVRRPNPGVNPNPLFLQTLQDYSAGYTLTSSTMNFQFGVIPFPLFSLGNGFNYYYRIPTQFFHLDGEPDGMWSLNPRSSFRIFVPGTYEVTFQFTDVTHS